MSRPFTVFGSVLILLLIGIFVVPQIVLGGAKVYHLKPAAPLTGQVSQALAAQTDRATLPVVGQDYTLQNPQYFANNTWAVATVDFSGSNSDSGTVVLRKQQGVFQVVLGPGTSFPVSYAQSMPADVVSYLYQKGVF